MIEEFYIALNTQLNNTGYTHAFGTSRGLTGDYCVVEAF